MRIRVFASYREIVNEKYFNIEDVVVLRNVFEFMILKFDFGKKMEVNEFELYNQSIVLINGKNSKFLNGLDSIIEEDDDIAIFPIVCGG